LIPLTKLAKNIIEKWMQVRELTLPKGFDPNKYFDEFLFPTSSKSGPYYQGKICSTFKNTCGSRWVKSRYGVSPYLETRLCYSPVV
jgi:hypothetical protein